MLSEILNPFNYGITWSNNVFIACIIVVTKAAPECSLFIILKELI